MKRQEFDEKQKKTEEKREEFRIKKEEELIVKKQMAEEKNEEIKRILAQNEERERAKREVRPNITSRNISRKWLRPKKGSKSCLKKSPKRLK